jgi:hypothetical protein
MFKKGDDLYFPANRRRETIIGFSKGEFGGGMVITTNGMFTKNFLEEMIKNRELQIIVKA